MKEMDINQAIEAILGGAFVRNENFAAGTFCESPADGVIYDPELGEVSPEEFRNEYKHFPLGWYAI